MRRAIGERCREGEAARVAGVLGGEDWCGAVEKAGMRFEGGAKLNRKPSMQMRKNSGCFM